MIKPELVDRIRRQAGQGDARQDVVNSLLFGGWEEQDIKDSFAEADRLQDVLKGGDSEISTKNFPSAGELFEKSWNLYKAHLGTFLKIAGVPIVLDVIFIIVLLYYSIVHGLTLQEIIATAAWPVLLLVMAVSLIAYVFRLWSQAALIYAVKSEGNIKVKEAYRRSFSKVAAFIWIAFLSSLIIFGGFMFFIVPGLIFAVWFSMVYFVIIDENLRGTDALLRSREYIRGNFFKVAGLLLGLFLYLLVILIVLSVLGIVLAAVVTGLLVSSGLVDVESAVRQLNNAEIKLDFSFVLYPISIAYTYFVYRHLQEIKLKSDSDQDYSSRRKIKYLAAGVSGIVLFIAVLVLLLAS